MIYCNVCRQYSPDGSLYCVHCNPNGPPTPVITPVPQQMQQPQPYYTQPNYGQQYQEGGLFGEFQPKVGSFLGFFLAWCVPILNLIMFFKLCFGKNQPPLKQAYVRAIAILALISIGISILVSVLAAIAGASLIGSITDLIGGSGWY